MKSTTKLQISIFALLLLTTTTLTKSPLFGKGGKRVLQGTTGNDGVFGDYKMKQELAETCSSYEENEIQYTEDEFKEGHDSIKGYFTFLQEPLRDYMKTQSTAKLEEAGKGNWYRFGINAVFAVVSLLMTFVFIIYFFCMTLCACLCCCCDDELEKDLADKPGDSEMKRRKKAKMRIKREKKIKNLQSKGCTACIVITSLILVTGIIVLGAIWSVYIFNSVGGIKRTDCAASYFFSDIRFGVKDGDITFIGLGGVKYFFETLKVEINDLTSPNTIVDEQLDVKADELFPSLEAFYNKYKDKTVTSCTGTGTATPDSIRTMNVNVTEFVGKEFEILQQAAKEIHNAATTANELAGAAGDGFKQSLNSFIDQINQADDSIVKFQNDFLGRLDTNKNSGYASLGAWGIMIGTAGLMIFFLLLMACSLNAKCTTFTTCLEAILAILKMFFAFIINTLSLVFLVIGIAVINFCVFAYDSMNDKQLGKDLFPKEVMDIFNICMYNDSTGNILELVGGSSLTDVGNIRDMASGFSYNLDELNITSTEPPSIKIYREQMLAQWRSYNLSDFQASPADDPQILIDNGNTVVGCTNDEWQIFDEKCTKSPKSKNTDAPDANLATSYCLVPSLTDPTGFTTGNQRYAVGNCAAAQAIPLTNLLTCVRSHDTLIDEMDTDISTTVGCPKEKAVAIYQGLTNAKTQFQDLQNKLKKSTEFIASTVESLPELMNCKIFRKEMRNMLGNACYRFTRNFTIQAILLAIIGPMMTVLAFCVCCTYMKSKIADDLDDLKKAKKKEDKNTAHNRGNYAQPGYAHGQQVPGHGYR